MPTGSINIKFGLDVSLMIKQPIEMAELFNSSLNPLSPVPAVTGRAKTHPQFPVPAVTGRKNAGQDNCPSYPP